MCSVASCRQDKVNIGQRAMKTFRTTHVHLRTSYNRAGIVLDFGGEGFGLKAITTKDGDFKSTFLG
jgi:hypothetical protein